ncbi:hypothetical protein LCGC14_1731040 [marine sediment metagenome]|uniref:Uncharacterized protein n=1 Tax=marine sediment metagenome TaxID=412755 RepID=A0A0F9HX91_9ZZZZ
MLVPEILAIFSLVLLLAWGIRALVVLFQEWIFEGNYWSIVGTVGVILMTLSLCWLAALD